MINRAPDFDVAICGGGMVGATLAALLLVEPALSSLRIALIEERFPDHPPGDDIDLRVSALSRASQRLLQHCGAWQRLPAAQRSAYQDMVVWDAASHHDAPDSLRFSAASLGEPDLGHIVANPWTQWCVLEAARHPRVTRFAAGVTQIDLPSADQSLANVQLSDGRRFTSSLVVGADGARSRSRECVGIATQVKTYPQTAVVTHLTPTRSHQATAWQRFLPSGPLALLPLQDGRVSLVWSTSHAEAERLLALSDAGFGHAVSDATDRVLGPLSVAAKRAAFPLQVAQVDEYCRAHFVLIGDAAHSVHPLAGQGVNLGMMDAACLVEVLTTAASGGASAHELGELRVLRRYERWRKHDNTRALALMDGINHLFSNDSALWRPIRRGGFVALQRLPLVKQMLIQHALGTSGDLPRMARALASGPV